MATTFNTPFMQKPDAGFRLVDGRSFWDAVVNANGHSAAYGITAVGTTAATAVQLTSVINQVDTAAASTGVNLPLSTGNRATPFQICYIINNGANAIQVYGFPGSSDTINGTAGATGISQPSSVNTMYVSAKGGQWESFGSGQNAAFGAITVTSVNGNTITTGTGTLTLAAGKTLTANNTITLAGTDGTTMTFPATSDTVAGLGTAQTYTAVQTYTNSDIKLLGSSTGTNTFTALNSTATNFTTSVPAVTGVLASTSGANLYIVDVKRCSASVTANATTTYANVTGLTQIVVPGTYRFSCRLASTVASGTGGIKYAFNYTTTVLSSIEATGIGQAAAASATQHTTTTTTQTDLFTQAAVVLFTDIEGSMVVTTGGTIDLQMAQNTSNGSNTVALIGSTMEFTRIA